jgi:hypothetical protein
MAQDCRVAWRGVYLLGAIEPAAVPWSTATLRLPNCRAELSGLAGLPSLLRRVSADVTRQLLAEARR